MEPAEFGQLVKSLRKATYDPSGNPWTRESLSSYIHLSVNQLGRLERGDRKYFDNHTLALLCEAFKLSPIERKEFLLAAAGITDADFCNHLSPVEQLSEVAEVAANIQTPIFVLDAFQDIIATNQACLELFMINREMIEFARQLPIGFNLLYYLYSKDLGFQDLLGPAWNVVAMIQIHQFRRTSLRFRQHKYYKYLLNELLKEPKFDIDWYTSHRSPNKNYQKYEYFSYNQKAYGDLKYIATETNTDTLHGELQLIIYNPSDSKTALLFNRLAETSLSRITKLATWPEKPGFEASNN